MRYLKSVLVVIGAVTVLALAGNSLALATTGHSLLLGKSNSANASTSITRTTSGTVLKLTSTSSSNAPLAVNGKGRVANLNADTVDGLDSSTLMGVRSHVYRYEFTNAAVFHSQTLPTLASGSYLVSFSVPLEGASGSAAAPTWAYCQIRQSGSGVADSNHGTVQATNGSAVAAPPYLSSTSVVSTSGGNTLTLYCNASVTWKSSGVPAEVDITKLDGATIAAVVDSTG